MKFITAKKSRGSVINITSLIDVMFLLLIFVLLSAKFEQERGITVALPTGETKDAAAPEIAVLSLTPGGELYWGKDRITVADLAPAVKDLREKMADPVLVINADKAVPYGVLAEILDRVKLAGQSKFYLKTAP
jgi:biopolymer transport protein ExbD